jgi:hypothetical protein
MRLHYPKGFFSGFRTLAFNQKATITESRRRGSDQRIGVYASPNAGLTLTGQDIIKSANLFHEFRNQPEIFESRFWKLRC